MPDQVRHDGFVVNGVMPNFVRCYAERYTQSF